MHDRRVNGRVLTFGNQGALFLNAMTWWDHETESLWSQPWGSAVAGPLEGTALMLVPASIVPWTTWFDQHPETSVLDERLGSPVRTARPRDDFVIGVALGDFAKAYYFETASSARVVNDHVGEEPVVVFADADTRDIKVYLRRVAESDAAGPAEVAFEIADDGRVLDTQSRSEWDLVRGVSTAGPLKGTVLQQIPYVTSYDWAWHDFFPHTTFYGS